MKYKALSLLALAAGLLFAYCGKSGKPSNSSTTTTTTTTASTSDVAEWLTTTDQSFLLKKQEAALNWSTIDSTGTVISIDSTQTYQSIDGFGYTLTEGSAYVLSQMSTAGRAALLQEMFGSDSASISVSYLRIGIGATDMSTSVYSYDDMPTGQTDPSLTSFNLGPDSTYLIPILQQILAINPNIKIIATPWSAPVWMKDTTSTVGGSLQTQYYQAYANYFVKYIQKMASKGIAITAITPQNEPLNPANNPSMYMTANAEAAFIGNYLGPTFANNSIKTQIICYDHNCDDPGYATTVLGISAAYNYVTGSAFHLYAGSITALGTVHNAYPDKNVYFTEQYTATTGSFSGDLPWHTTNVVIGSLNNWSKTALEWNFANNASFGPSTPGGCTTCLGALTINGSSYTRNVGYYIIAHASKFIPTGSTRIASNTVGGFVNTAFLTPSGKKVLLIENTGSATTTFQIRYKGKGISTALAGGAVATYIW